MHRVMRRLLTLLLGTALAAGSLTLVAAPAQAAAVPPPARGTVIAWGENDSSTVPQTLSGKSVVAVASGSWHSLALTADGVVTGWGSNPHGQADVPKSLDGKNVVAISAGTLPSMALTDDGAVTVWGYDGYGLQDVPGNLTGRKVVEIDAGTEHVLALTEDGEVIAWGNTGQGRTAVPASSKRFTAIAAGNTHSLALDEDGEVTAWGSNYFGQSSVPASLTGRTVVAIAAGNSSSLALTDDGDLVAWGRDDLGQADVPSSVMGRTVAISAGGEHALALTEDGTLTAWGYESWTTAPMPTLPVGTRVTAFDAGPHDSLAIIITDPPSVTTGLVDDTVTVAAGEDVDLRIGATGANFQSALVLRGTNSPAMISGTGDRWRIHAWATPGTYDYRVQAQTDRGTLTTTVTVVVTPAAIASLGVTAPATATYGDTVSVTAAGADRYGNATGDETGRVTVASSDPADTVSGTDVTFGSAGPRTLTVTHTPTGLTATRTVTVALHSFSTRPAPGISGVVKVGETLTADAGPITPAPDSLTFQWLADDREITGATGTELTLAPEHEGARISVRATARLTGHADATETSAPTAPVAGVDAPSVAAPTVTLDASKERLRRGQSTTLTWRASDATTVTASGAWRGTKPATGRATVEPALGTSVYRLTATNKAGTTTAQVAVTATRPAKRLNVAATAKPVVRGSRTTVAVTGLDARERYSVAIGGRTVAHGTADTRGRARIRVAVPVTRPSARRTVVVTGSLRDRTGRDTLAVVTGRLTATAAKPAASASSTQRITVRGLVPGQKVRVTYRGQRVSASNARANAAGTYTVRFDVGQRWGTKSVVATSGGRTARTSFAVTPYRR